MHLFDPSNCIVAQKENMHGYHIIVVVAKNNLSRGHTSCQRIVSAFTVILNVILDEQCQNNKINSNQEKYHWKIVKIIGGFSDSKILCTGMLQIRACIRCDISWNCWHYKKSAIFLLQMLHAHDVPLLAHHCPIIRYQTATSWLYRTRTYKLRFNFTYELKNVIKCNGLVFPEKFNYK